MMESADSDEWPEMELFTCFAEQDELLIQQEQPITLELEQESIEWEDMDLFQKYIETVQVIHEEPAVDDTEVQLDEENFDSPQKSKKSSKSNMGSKQSKVQPMIPYRVHSERKEDPNFVKLIFECCIAQKAQQPSQICAIPTENELRNQIRKIKQPSASLGRCIQATHKDKIFFYAMEKIPTAQNSFLAKRWFTTGLQRVDNNIAHKIRRTDNMEEACRFLVVYFCKDDKRCQYENHVNIGDALVNEQQINDDFYVRYLENEQSVSPGSIYFFYTACAAAFRIDHCKLQTIPPFQADTECIILDYSPKNKEQLKPKAIYYALPNQKPMEKNHLSMPLNLKASPLQQADQATSWEVKNKYLAIKKRKLNTETDVASCSKAKDDKIAEITEQASETKREMEELKDNLRQTIQNLKAIWKTLKYQ